MIYTMGIENKLKRAKKILLLGGYGYGNVGDEAQLSATIDIIKEEYPNSIVKVLTPNLSYTAREHNCSVGLAPRVAFYDQGTSKIYSINNKNKKSPIHYLGNEFFKLLFLLRSFWIMFNAVLIKLHLPSFLLGAKRVALLEEIRTSDLVYFVGGGYLTGKTLSRLWDGMFFIRIANIFKVPVVASGQTIGVWNSRFNKVLAKWGLKKVRAITLRDPEDSLAALKEIGLEGENIFVTCDDALFCRKEESQKEVEKFLIDSGMDAIKIKEGFVTLNIHYWGLNTQAEKNDLLVKIKSIVDVTKEKGFNNILFIPMTPSDEQTIDDYLSSYKEEGLYKFKYEYDFRIIRAVIAQSKLCITMKHHPIIFAVGEKKPVISLALGDYYEHKNKGALKLVGLDKYNVSLDDKDYLLYYNDRIDSIINNEENIKSIIEENFKHIKERKKKFISIVKEQIN